MSATEDSDSRASSPSLLAPTLSTSTNFVHEAILAPSSEGSECEGTPILPWRTGADTLPQDTPPVYLGATDSDSDPPAGTTVLGVRRYTKKRVRVRRKRYTVIEEDGISRDFFLILVLCFVFACLLVLSARPFALEMVWYMEDP